VNKKLLRISLALAILAFGTSALAQSLAANSDFQTGDFTGWTISGNPNSLGVCNISDCQAGEGFVPLDTYAAYFAPGAGMQAVGQNIATTPGQEYTLAFFVADPQGGAPAYFSVDFGSASVTVDNFGGSFGWQEYELSTTATSGETQLQFSMQNNPGFWFLDNIMVVQDSGSAPEPGTIVLFGSGLLAMGSIARRKLRL
jgi:hypothetical protein